MLLKTYRHYCSECQCVALQTETDSPDVVQYEVVEVHSQTQIDRQKAGLSLQGLKHNRRMSEGLQSPQDAEEESGEASADLTWAKKQSVNFPHSPYNKT